MLLNIKITDYTAMVEGLDFDGGSYTYKEIADVKDGSIIAGKHTCSSVFEYCECCGEFHERDIDCEYIPSYHMASIIESLTNNKPIVVPDNFIVKITIDNISK